MALPLRAFRAPPLYKSSVRTMASSCTFAHHDGTTRFPLRISADAALSSTAMVSQQNSFPFVVRGHTTGKIRAAGCPGSLLLASVPSEDHGLCPAARDVFAALLRKGDSGCLPAICAAKAGFSRGPDVEMEAVLLGRPSPCLTSLSACGEDILLPSFPVGVAVEVTILRVLMPFQPNCPVEWLAERFEHLSDSFEAHFGPPRDNPWESFTFQASQETRERVQRLVHDAGLGSDSDQGEHERATCAA
eukprot:gnl/TRDRNA2_/TRDRNA2_198084_c0_seq1.p1 gnl/TRDRNA2_/TRDRNA2_198084_c0~~gnl/TRDRNA2_/TRDRNA2_198084_c0_seq1.p1  ORF type:complete len:246 (+),score=38.92 gnl/TRDRNA2_/TRDRNA2_198084_c0_seq1:25-762(+)